MAAIKRSGTSPSGAPLFHGLGNFIFQTRKVDGAYGDETWRSLMIEAEFRDGRFTGVDIRPLTLRSDKRGEFTVGVPAQDR